MLKEQRPDIIPKELLAKIDRWYRIRPDAENGDGLGRVVDPSRYFR